MQIKNLQSSFLHAASIKEIKKNELKDIQNAS